MDILCLILFMSTVALWFFTNEYDTLFGVYKPTCAINGREFNLLAVTGLLAALWHSHAGAGAVKETLTDCFDIGHIECGTVMIILLSSLIVLTIMKYFRVRGSIIYALAGALSAYGLITDSLDLEWKFMLSFAAAPLLAFLLSAGIRLAFRAIFSKVKIHMITMSYYMRHAVILCIVLTIYALGVNWGGMLGGIGEMIADGRSAGIGMLAVIGVIMLAIMHVDKEQNDEASGIFTDFSIYAVISTGLATASSLLFFSFDATASLVGLTPAPLSVSSLVFAAIAGAEVSQKSRLVDNGDYIKEGIAFIAAPSCSFVLAYLLFNITGGESADSMTDFIVMAAALLILTALMFAGYARRQRMLRDATDRLVYAQQQQIYEHSRALNDMELKVVLSENQALHNAIEMKRQEVMNVALSIVEQKEFLESVNSLVNQMKKTDDIKEKDRLTAELSSALKQRLSYDRDIDSQYFYAQAESLHEDFNAKLSENFPNLTQQEKRLATLLRLGFSSKYIATLMNITPKSVEISRYRLRQKLGLGKGDNLVNFIKSI